MDANTGGSAESELNKVSTRSPSQNTAINHEPSRIPKRLRPHALIKSEQDGLQLNLGQLWIYRELLYFFILRDIKVRYRQTLLGIGWVLIQPLLTMLIFTLVFTRFVRVETGPIPYPLFALSGLLLWIFFAQAVTNGANSLVLSTQLITKVYFPRLFLPATPIGTGLLDLAISSVLMAALAFYYEVRLTWNVLLLPLFVLMTALLALGMGLLFSALSVKYRDLRQVLPFLLQIWMFASPVIYPISLVPERWRWLVTLNPIAAILDGWRAALLGGDIGWRHLAIAATITMALLLGSIYIFRRAEDSFADEI